MQNLNQDGKTNFPTDKNQKFTGQFSENLEIYIYEQDFYFADTFVGGVLRSS